MAAMDYTQLVFNNGKLWADKNGFMKDIVSGYRVFTIGKYGNVGRVLSKSNINDTGEHNNFHKYRLNHRVGNENYGKGFVEDGAYDMEIKPSREVYYGEYNHIKFYEIDYNYEGYNCFFMWDDFGNHYAWVGGYGHHGNPYLHFYGRGYDDKFYKQMCKECYNWLMTDVLEDIADILWGTPFYCPNYENEEYIEEQDYEWQENFIKRIHKEYNYVRK
ncbi:MAG: hypothetical protein J6J36_07045 [Clostridia bacterium]|nr:hypothetical protein [Clostridia bacterium]